MHTRAFEQPLVVFEPPVNAIDRAMPVNRTGAAEWRSLVGTGIVALAGAMALIGAVFHALR